MPQRFPTYPAICFEKEYTHPERGHSCPQQVESQNDASNISDVHLPVTVAADPRMSAHPTDVSTPLRRVAMIVESRRSDSQSQPLELWINQRVHPAADMLLDEPQLREAMPRDKIACYLFPRP